MAAGAASAGAKESSSLGMAFALDRRLLDEVPQGFARFVLQAVDPNIEVLSEEALGELATTLGCELRVVRARY